MAWVQGQLLDRCVEGLLDKPRELAALRERFRGLVKDIEKAKFAHGDLQHGNILVDGKELLLIDYDGMWVPALLGRQATEIGHRAYQHPKRGINDYGQWLDRFSALVIYLSLLALEVDRKLWDQYYTGDNLIFTREDFNEPGKTPVWGDLASLQHGEVTRLAGILAAMIGRPLKDLPRLEAVISKSGGLKPLELKAGGPRAPEKPRWSAKPSKSGSAADLTAQWKVVWTRPGEKIESRWKKEVKDGPVEVESEVEVLAPNPRSARNRRHRSAGGGRTDRREHFAGAGNGRGRRRAPLHARNPRSAEEDGQAHRHQADRAASAGAAQGRRSRPQVGCDLAVLHRRRHAAFRGDPARRMCHLGAGQRRVQDQQRPPAAVRALGPGVATTRGPRWSSTRPCWSPISSRG